MSHSTYKVIFTGKIREGFTVAQVRANLKALWPADARHLDRLFCGRSAVVKKGLDRQTAERYRDYFQSTGAVCRIAAQAGGLEVADITCPKCGLAQATSEECIGCGIVFAKFSTLQEAGPDADSYDEAPDDPMALTDKEIRRKNVAFVALLVSMALFLTALYMKNRLPDTGDILPALYQMPRQSPARALSFDTRQGGRSYHITPLFDYELWGLVVSYYDTTGWWDVTHRFLWRDFINIKDICVLYGFNVRTDAYKDMGFKSGSYTCFAKLKTERARMQFMGQCLSNNHLLADKRRIKKAVMRAKPGDQIYLKGYLAGYGFTGSPPSRLTSTTRNDTGDGACETVYLTEFKILKTGNIFWRHLFALATYAMAGTLVFLVYTHVRQYRRAAGRHGLNNVPGGTFIVKIVFQLLLLLLLLCMWARIH